MLCKKSIYILAAVALLVAGTVSAQQLKNRVAPICTDVSNTATAREAGFIPCDWYQTGISASTPEYVRIVDRNTTLTLDVETLTTLLGGLSGGYRAQMSIAVLAAMDATTTNTFEALTMSASVASITPIWGLNVHGMAYLWDAVSSRYRRWDMLTPADNMTNADMQGGVVVNANMFWDPSNNEWRRDYGDEASSDAVVNTTIAPYRLTLGHIQLTDGAVWARDSGETADGGAVAATVPAAYRLSLGYVWDGTDWAPTGADANGDLTVNQTTTTPGYARLQDGDSTVLGDVLDAVADNLALTLNWTATASVLLGYDGSTLDMLRVGASGELQVTDVATRAGEDAGNDWRKVKKEETAVYNPAVTAGTAVDDSADDVVCASTYVLNLPNWSVFVKNAGGGNGDALSDVDVQISYDGTNWSSETSTACDTLTSGNSARCYKGANESAAYVQVIATCGGGDDTTVDCVIQGNKN